MGRRRTIASVLKADVGGIRRTHLPMPEARRLVVVDHADRLHQRYCVMAYESKGHVIQLILASKPRHGGNMKADGRLQNRWPA